MPFADLLADFASAYQQDNRILRLRFAANSGIAEDALTPETLSGGEQLSRCYRYVLTCLSPDAGLELKYFNGLPAEIGIELPDSTERTITGLVSSSHQLASDGGFARYQLTIEPVLALLSQRRAARVFQDQNVMQIIGQILDEHRAANPIFQQSFAWQADLSKDYPSRSYCIQYRESDLEFINRLAAEEGISYRFQYTPGDNPLHTVIFFDDPLSLPQNPQSKLRFGHAEPGLDKNPGEDVVKEWNGSRKLVPGLTSLASYDYKPVVTHQTQANSRINAGDAGTDAQSSLESYDPQTQYYGADSDEVQRYAALRQDAKDAQAKRFSGQSQVRDLHLGHWFTLDNHPVHDQDLPREREFLVTGFNLEARNNLVNGERETVYGKTTPSITDHQSPNYTPFQNSFSAVRRGIPLHPEHITKPSAPGMQTATVVGPANEEIHTDQHGRIKLQFHWQRPQDHPQGTANLNDKSSTWVRVAHSSAGANWGSQFIPRIGQEVLVDFIEGDIDRPVVVGLAHNGRNMPATFSGAGTLPANKTLSGIKSKEYKGNLYNELLFDDTTNETRVKLSSEHAKTQLNQGYLIHPRTEGKGEPRGEGFELRTDAAGAIRSAKGLLISTDARRSATGKQLDRQELTSNLKAAYELANTLGEHAAHQLANLPETGKDNQTVTADKAPGSQSKSGHQNHLIEALESLEKGTNTDKAKSSDNSPSPSQGEGWGGGQNTQPGAQPLIGISAPAGIAIATPNSTTISTGTNFDQVSQRDTNQTTGRRWIHNVGESISLFVSGTKATLKETLKLIAAKGKIQVQAQSGEIEATADQAIKLTSVSASQLWAGKTDITFVCGGAYVKISNGNIEIHAPGTVSMKGASVPVAGPASMSVGMPEMPVMPMPGENLYSQRIFAVSPVDGSGQAIRYKLFEERNELEKGKTDGNGAIPRRIEQESEDLLALVGPKGSWQVEFPNNDTPFPVDRDDLDAN